MRLAVWTEGRYYKTQRDGEKVNGKIQGEVAVNAKDQIFNVTDAVNLK